MTKNLDDIYQELDREHRLTYKVKVLYDWRVPKEQAWEIISAHRPGFIRSTFMKSWLALTKSDGRTPLYNHV